MEVIAVLFFLGIWLAQNENLWNKIGGNSLLNVEGNEIKKIKLLI